MKKKWDGLDRRRELRVEAESLVSGLAPNEISALPHESLLHELLVHKVELEMQNEELRKSHISMEENRDRYWHLYEFSPLSYITLNRENMIYEINLTGCSMLGVIRTEIIKRRFTNWIAPHEQNRWHRFFLGLMLQNVDGKQSIDIEMLREDGSNFHAHLDCVLLKTQHAPSSLRIALTDISKIKQAEYELRISAVVFESMESLMVTDANNIILRVNQAFSKNTGYSSKDIIGQKPSLLKSGRHQSEFYRLMWESIDQTSCWEGEVWNKRKNGEVYSELLSITAVKNELNIIMNYIGIYTNKIELANNAN